MTKTVGLSVSPSKGVSVILSENQIRSPMSLVKGLLFYIKLRSKYCLKLIIIPSFPGHCISEDTKSVTSLSIVRHPPEATNNATLRKGNKKDGREASMPFSHQTNSSSALEENYGWVRVRFQKYTAFFLSNNFIQTH